MKKKLISLFLAAAFFSLCVKSADAATLHLSPSSGNFNVGDDILVELVLVKTTGEAVWGVGAEFTYPATLLDYDRAGFVAGSLFPSPQAYLMESVSPVTVSGAFLGVTASVPSGGTVATLKFKAKAAGTATVTLNCPGQTITTGVSLAAAAADESPTLINCAAEGNTLGGAIYNIAAAEGETPAPTATPTTGSSSGSSGSSPTSTPIPGSSTLTTLPETGTFDGIAKLIYVGIGLIICGGFLALRSTRITSGQ